MLADLGVVHGRALGRMVVRFRVNQCTGLCTASAPNVVGTAWPCGWMHGRAVGCMAVRLGAWPCISCQFSKMCRIVQNNPVTEKESRIVF
ncbi:hypothetical protein HanPI659440_Chr17g0674121 [Helianthus annuus]|nr:hypothetical protein HanPI659440_Chr17g0674121 [Helianthus annuus]